MCARHQAVLLDLADADGEAEVFDVALVRPAGIDFADVGKPGDLGWEFGETLEFGKGEAAQRKRVVDLGKVSHRVLPKRG
jgi:hypothetical protein